MALDESELEAALEEYSIYLVYTIFADMKRTLSRLYTYLDLDLTAAEGQLLACCDNVWEPGLPRSDESGLRPASDGR